MRNHTITTFILLGLTDDPKLQVLLFVFLFLTYMLSVAGNLIIITLTLLDSHLKTPMYYFLRNFSVLEVSFTTVCIPRFLYSMATGDNTVTYNACATQLFFVVLFAATEFFLLAAMSYDRYIAVCHPLHYPVLMRRQVCLLMVGISWLSGVLVASIQTSITLHFPYCASRTVDHFFCELPALLKLSCADTSAYELALSISGVLILVLPLSLIATSYSHVLGAVLHMHSAEARHKAFTTCSSHITAVGLFYGAAVFMYMVPGAYHSPHQDNMVSLFYSLITPTLNPLIYSLRNREVWMALVKVLRRPGLRAK